MSTHDHRGHRPAPSARHIQRSHTGAVCLVEISPSGDIDIIGPLSTLADAERLSTQLLSAAGLSGALPEVLHKLAVAVLALRGVDRLSDLTPAGAAA